MSIFKVDQVVTPAATAMADGFRKEANQAFERELESAYDAVQRFWFRNKDADGNPIATASDEDPQPTGPEILEAMGTDAQGLMAVAYARVAMILGIQQQLGLPAETVDMAQLALPYDMSWADNGSLKSATLADWYVASHPQTEA